MDRRAFLGAGAGAAVTALAGCGGGGRRIGPHDRAVARRSIGIDYASYYPPVMDLQRLVRRHAAARGAAITFSRDPSGPPAQRANLREWTGDRGGFGAVVVAPFDRTVTRGIAARARENHIALVSYLTPVSGQRAGIRVDPAAAGRRLGAAAGRWARGHGGGEVLFVRPVGAPAIPDPFASLAAPAERATRGALSGALRPVGVVHAEDADDARAAVLRALGTHPGIRVVLCASDTAAVGAGQALRQKGVSGFAGGVALAGVADLATLDAVGRGEVDCLVAPRLDGLARRLVDVPLALARGRAPGPATVPTRALTRGAGDLAAYRADYGTG